MVIISDLNEWIKQVVGCTLPENACLKLQPEDVTLENIQKIAHTIPGNKRPNLLQINLSGNNIGAEGAKIIAQALQSPHCPAYLQINLSDNNIGVEGAKAIAQALQNPNCPIHLQINLNFNHLDVEGAEAIALALQNPNCPAYLDIDLSENFLSVKGAKAIAQALQSRNCPTYLQINLRENNLAAEGIKAITQALQSGNCPAHLQINLSDNQIGIEGAKAIVEALQSGNCPANLQLNLDDNKLSIENNNAIQAAWKIHHQHFGLLAIALVQGERDTKSTLSQLPQDILKQIYHDLGIEKYIDYAKMIRPVKWFINRFSLATTVSIDEQLAQKSQISSENTIQFAKELKDLLKNPRQQKATDLRKTIKEFLLKQLSKEQYVQSNTIKLLQETHIIDTNSIDTKVVEHPEIEGYFKLK